MSKRFRVGPRVLQSWANLDSANAVCALDVQSSEFPKEFQESATTLLKDKEKMTDLRSKFIEGLIEEDPIEFATSTEFYLFRAISLRINRLADHYEVERQTYMVPTFLYFMVREPGFFFIDAQSILVGVFLLAIAYAVVRFRPPVLFLEQMMANLTYCGFWELFALGIMFLEVVFLYRHTDFETNSSWFTWTLCYYLVRLSAVCVFLTGYLALEFQQNYDQHLQAPNKKDQDNDANVTSNEAYHDNAEEETEQKEEEVVNVDTLEGDTTLSRLSLYVGAGSHVLTLATMCLLCFAHSWTRLILCVYFSFPKVVLVLLQIVSIPVGFAGMFIPLPAAYLPWLRSYGVKICLTALGTSLCGFFCNFYTLPYFTMLVGFFFVLLMRIFTESSAVEGLLQRVGFTIFGLSFLVSNVDQVLRRPRTWRLMLKTSQDQLDCLLKVLRGDLQEADFIEKWQSGEFNRHIYKEVDLELYKRQTEEMKERDAYKQKVKEQEEKEKLRKQEQAKDTDNKENDNTNNNNNTINSINTQPTKNDSNNTSNDSGTDNVTTTPILKEEHNKVQHEQEQEQNRSA